MADRLRMMAARVDDEGGTGLGMIMQPRDAVVLAAVGHGGRIPDIQGGTVRRGKGGIQADRHDGMVADRRQVGIIGSSSGRRIRDAQEEKIEHRVNVRCDD